MKKLFLTAFISAAALLTVASERLHFDRFELPIKRTVWLKAGVQNSDWQKELKLTAFGTRWRLRYSTASGAVKKLEVVDPSGKVVLVDNKCKGGIWIPTPSAGEYTLKFTGVASKKPINIATDTYDLEVDSEPVWKSTFMPSWENGKCTVSANPDGGIIAIPNDKSASLYTTIRGHKPNKPYKIEFEVSTGETQNVNIRCSWKPKGARFRSMSDKNIEVVPGKYQNIVLLVEPKADPFYVSINFKKQLKIKYFSFSKVKGELPKQRMIGSSKAFFEPRNNKPDPKVEYSSPVVYKRPLRMTYMDSIPQKHEVVDKIHTFAAQGDYAVWYFTVHNPVGSRRIGNAEITDLKLADNSAVIPAKSVDLSSITFDDYPSSSCNYMNIPERILPLSGKFAAPEGSYNRIFWFQSKLPENQKPGIYTGSAKFICGEKTITLPITLRVLPFKLEEPKNMFWATYSNAYHNQKRHYAPEVTERYLKDMVDYGMKGIHYNNAMSFEPAMKKVQEARKKIGMNGPLILAGIGAERRCRDSRL